MHHDRAVEHRAWKGKENGGLYAIDECRALSNRTDAWPEKGRIIKFFAPRAHRKKRNETKNWNGKEELKIQLPVSVVSRAAGCSVRAKSFEPINVRSDTINRVAVRFQSGRWVSRWQKLPMEVCQVPNELQACRPPETFRDRTSIHCYPLVCRAFVYIVVDIRRCRFDTRLPSES